jgi:predicted phage terminase large subunit-like protein
MDTAYTDSAKNDPSGVIATCKIGNNLYITAAQKWQLNFPNLIRAIPPYVQAHGYTLSSTIRIEPKANGLSVIDQLKENTKLNITKTPTPTESKEQRLNAVSPYIECGRIYLVTGAWCQDFVDEIAGFPAKSHDEYVDLIAYAIDYHLKARNKVDIRRMERVIA